MNWTAMQWKITLQGHTAVVAIKLFEDTTFTGTITSSEYGEAPITEGRANGNTLTGKVTLNDVSADIVAVIQTDGDVTGKVKVGWFFHYDFLGTRC